MIRVELVLATTELIDADLAGPERLGSAIGAEVAKDWPPEHHDEGALGWMRTLAEDPGSRGWGMYYITVPEGERSLVVGTCGFHGPPEDGVAEVGYSVVPDHQRRGIATSAVQQLIGWAWERGVSSIRANTMPHLRASIGVLEKLGFVPAEPSRAGVVTYELVRT